MDVDEGIKCIGIMKAMSSKGEPWTEKRVATVVGVDGELTELTLAPQALNCLGLGSPDLVGDTLKCLVVCRRGLDGQ